ncbi:MAG: hypothetical protein FWE53_00570 [Firmicutes bacterium]|nr:hypothetical protein [Bacillota bacterium]
MANLKKTNGMLLVTEYSNGLDTKADTVYDVIKMHINFGGHIGATRVAKKFEDGSFVFAFPKEKEGMYDTTIKLADTEPGAAVWLSLFGLDNPKLKAEMIMAATAKVLEPEFAVLIAKRTAAEGKLDYDMSLEGIKRVIGTVETEMKSKTPSVKAINKAFELDKIAFGSRASDFIEKAGNHCTMVVLEAGILVDHNIANLKPDGKSFKDLTKNQVNTKNFVIASADIADFMQKTNKGTPVATK